MNIKEGLHVFEQDFSVGFIYHGDNDPNAGDSN